MMILYDLQDLAPTKFSVRRAWERRGRQRSPRLKHSLSVAVAGAGVGETALYLFNQRLQGLSADETEPSVREVCQGGREVLVSCEVEAGLSRLQS